MDALAELNAATLLKICGQFRGSIPIQQPEGAFNPGYTSGGYLHRPSPEDRKSVV